MPARIECPITEEELRHMATVENISDIEIAKRIGEKATQKRVRSWRERWGIPAHLRSMSGKGRSS